MRASALLIVTCLLPAALGCSTEEAEDRGFEKDLPGRWYAGDFHVHATGASNDTGGDSFPDVIANTARERGLYFVVLTDHSNSTGSDASTLEEDPALFNQGPEFPYWDLARTLSVPGELLMIDGNEISPVAAGQVPDEQRGHIGCIPPELEGFDTSGAFVDRPRGEVSGGEVLAQARARGCFSVINHPYALGKWTAYDWTSMDYDAVEVWNGTIGFVEFDRAAHAAWRCDLLQGRSTVAVGGSDCHHVHTEPPGELLHPALGYPTTSVFAADGTWPAIIEGLRAGHVTIREGQSWLELDGYDARRRRHAGTATRWLRVRGLLDPVATGGDEPKVVLTRTTSCTDARPAPDPWPVVTEDVLLDEVVAPGVPFDVATEIGGEPGVYTAMLHAPSVHYWALSRAVVIH